MVCGTLTKLLCFLSELADEVVLGNDRNAESLCLLVLA